MATRIYIVHSTLPGVEPRLVEAASQAQAINHVTADLFAARPATPREIADAFTSGRIGKVEVAGKEQT